MPLIEVGDINLFYRLEGKGGPIVFSHGWSLDHRMWEAQVEYFSANHRIILYDHRGHGRSDKPKTGYSIKQLVADLYSLIQGLGLGKVILVGHSMGSLIAQKFALAHPENVRKLVLASSTARIVDPLYISSLVSLGSFFAKLSRIHTRINISDINKLFEMWKSGSKVPMVQCTKAIASFDTRDEISEIEIPTLVIGGEEDLLIPKEMVEHLNQQIKDSVLAFIPAAGHMMMMEQPEAFNKILGEFIDNRKKF